jgi:amino acid transporter
MRGKHMIINKEAVKYAWRDTKEDLEKFAVVITAIMILVVIVAFVVGMLTLIFQLATFLGVPGPGSHAIAIFLTILISYTLFLFAANYWKYV